MATATRWRTCATRPVSLTDALTHLRAMDPGARLVVPIGPEPVDRVLIGGMTLDSAQAVPGDLFAGLPGAHHHGARYAPEAARNGAVGLLSDRAHPALPTLLVERPRHVLGPLASWLHGEPSAALDVHGVTGTCLLYTSPSPRDRQKSRMPSSA